MFVYLITCFLFLATCFAFILLIFLAWWRNGRALDLRSRGRGFDSRVGTQLRNDRGQVDHTRLPRRRQSSLLYGVVKPGTFLLTYLLGSTAPTHWPSGVKRSFWRALLFCQNHWQRRPHSLHSPRTYVSSRCCTMNGYTKYVPLPSPEPSSFGRTLASQNGPKKATPHATVAKNRMMFPVTRAQRAIAETAREDRAEETI